MKKWLMILIAVFLLTSCRLDIVDNILSDFDENPFLVGQEIEEGKDVDNSEPFTFLLFTDTHINRSKEDWNITETHNELIDVLERTSGELAFAVSLGDIEDAGDINASELHDFLSDFQNTGVTLLSCLANHELQLFHERSEWDELYASYGFKGTVGRYVYGPLSIYSLDSTKRIYGKRQLAWLEEALASDTSPLKIFITHVDTYTGGQLDTSLMFFGTADIAERNRIYRLMDQYGVGMLFNGHYHSGNLLTRHGDHLSEFKASSLHESELIPGRRLGGWYYLVTIDPASRTLTIDGRKLLDDSARLEHSVQL